MKVVLVTFGKKGDRKEFPLGKGPVIIGRKMDADLRIPLSQVSRMHCEFTVDEDEVSIRDLNSSNGTFVNHHKVSQAKLKAGDRIMIGPVVFTVQIDGVPEDIQPISAHPQPRKKAPADRATEVAPAVVESPEDEDFDIDDLGELDLDDLSDLDLDEIDDVEEVDLDEVEEVDDLGETEPALDDDEHANSPG